MSARFCTNCDAAIPNGVHPYTVRIEVFPSRDEVLNLDEIDLTQDIKSGMKVLIERMEAMTDEEVERETERMYSRFQFIICPRCREALAPRLRARMDETGEGSPVS